MHQQIECVCSDATKGHAANIARHSKRILALYAAQLAAGTEQDGTMKEIFMKDENKSNGKR
jgi:hypothetical protein